MKLYHFIPFLCLLSSCDKQVKFNYEDAKRSEVEYFFENDITLDFHHDLDNQVVEGYFISKDIKKYSSFVDSVASLHKWVKVINDTDKIMFVRKGNVDYSISAITFFGNEVHLRIYSF